MRRSILGPFCPFLFVAAAVACASAGCEDAAKPSASSEPKAGDAKTVATQAAADAPPAGAKDFKRIIILENDNSPFWDAARAGLQDAESELKLRQRGLRAVLEINNGTPAGQVEKLQQFGASRTSWASASPPSMPTTRPSPKSCGSSKRRA